MRQRQWWDCWGDKVGVRQLLALIWVVRARVYFISWSDWLFWAKPLRPDLPNREKKVWTKAFVPITAWHRAIVYALDGLGWRRPHLKSHIGDFSLVTNLSLSLFFWDVSLFCVVSHKIHFFFLARNEYLGVKKTQFPSYHYLAHTCTTLLSQYLPICNFTQNR